jgi:hypothetical protein
MMTGKRRSVSISERVRKNEDSTSHGTLSNGSVDFSIFSHMTQAIVSLHLSQAAKMMSL